MIDNKYNYNSLLRFRTALQSPIEYYFPNWILKNDEILSKLLKYAKIHIVKPKIDIAPWDLDKVLIMLKNPPSQVAKELDFIIKKSLFLTILANPLRISEFQAITISKCNFNTNHIILRPHQKFISKNQTNNFVPSDIIIPAFSECKKLCPVFNLNLYLKIKENICKEKGISRPDQLWIGSDGRILSKQKIRSMFRSIILAADPCANFSSCSFHSIRGIVASALDYRNIQINEILKRMNWNSTSTFQKYYAKMKLSNKISAVLAGRDTSI